MARTSARRTEPRLPRLSATSTVATTPLVRTYSLVGTCGDADFMVWPVSDRLEDLHEFSARLNRTAMGAFLTSPYSYFSMTKQSMYVEKHEHRNQEGRSSWLVIAPTNRRYPFVYPFVKDAGLVPAEPR